MTVDEIVRSLIDKSLPAIIQVAGAVLIAMRVQKAVEKYRHERSLVSEIVRARIAAINNTMECLAELRQAINDEQGQIEAPYMGVEAGPRTAVLVDEALPKAIRSVAAAEWLIGGPFSAKAGECLQAFRRACYNLVESEPIDQTDSMQGAKLLGELRGLVPELSRLTELPLATEQRARSRSDVSTEHTPNE